MTRLTHIASLCGLIILVAACTQNPVPVDYKGYEFFGREHVGALDSPDHETFPPDSPRLKHDYAYSVEPAGVQSVGVSDLPSPAQPQGGNGLNNAQPAPVAASQRSAPPARSAVAQANSQFIWPVAEGKVVSHFGPKSGGSSNDGINIAVAEGEPIWAAAGGTVVYAGNELKGYGNMVIIRHKDGWMTAYAHARSITVRKNDTVRQGDIIGYVGMTGSVQSPQLHFAVRNGRTPVDPELYLPRSTASAQ